MAVFLNNKVGVKVNSVDLSDHVTAVTLNRSFDELEVTAMGDTGHKFVKGLEASSITLSFLNDNDPATSVRGTLQSTWGTSVTVVLLQDKAAAVSTTNPLYTFTALINNTTDINGAVGDIGMQDVTWTVNGAIAVATTGSF
jgi:Flp pilus assembly protein TadG